MVFVFLSQNCISTKTLITEDAQAMKVWWVFTETNNDLNPFVQGSIIYIEYDYNKLNHE